MNLDTKKYISILYNNNRGISRFSSIWTSFRYRPSSATLRGCAGCCMLPGTVAVVVTLCHSCLFLITPGSRSTLSGTHWQLSVWHNKSYRLLDIGVPGLLTWYHIIPSPPQQRLAECVRGAEGCRWAPCSGSRRWRPPPASCWWGSGSGSPPQETPGPPRTPGGSTAWSPTPGGHTSALCICNLYLSLC